MSPGDEPIRRVGIVGLGLMGGSVARSLKAGEPVHISAWSESPDDLEAARTDGVIDVACAEAVDAVDGAHTVVYAAPLGATLDLLGEHAERLRAASLITDVVSLKVPVVERVRDLALGDRFVGAHPMVGGTGSGYAFSRPDLFRSARIWLTADDVGARAREVAISLWESVGGAVQWTTAADHDVSMVRGSHLPQLVANALARVMAEEGGLPGELGPGGRDMTRLAASSELMWADLLLHSGPQLAPRLAALANVLIEIGNSLTTGEMDAVAELMRRTREWKETGRWS